MQTKTIITTLGSILLSYSLTPAHAQIAQSPLFLTQSIEPNILIDMSVETPMGGAAYNDQNNTNSAHPSYNPNDLCNGRIKDSNNISAGICYNPKKKYIGIYNAFKCYIQIAGSNSAYFTIHSSTKESNKLPDENGFYPDATFQCNGQWSGNVLNWATMTAVDIFSVAMTGGNRITDTTSLTILEAARRHTSTSWFPSKIISTSLNVPPSTVTPYSADAIEIIKASNPYKFNVKVFGEGTPDNENGDDNDNGNNDDTATLYEDAEDQNTTGWTVYDNKPSGATISNVYDDSTGSRVIKFNGANGTKNGYQLGNETGKADAWDNSTQRIISWDMNYEKNYKIYILVNTTSGKRTLEYTEKNSDKGKKNNNIHHGLGSGSRDGNWHTITRNLADDLEEFDTNNQILTVDGFRIKGNGLVDNIQLKSIPISTDARYVKLVAKSSFNNQPWTSIAEIKLIDSTGAEIPRNTWTVTADSEEPTGEGAKGGHAIHTIDNNPATHWHTEWRSRFPNPPHDHHLIIDMGSSHSLQALRHLPRQDGGSNGRVNGYEIYFSQDGNNWGTAITSGNLISNSQEQTIPFTEVEVEEPVDNTDYTQSPLTEYVYNSKVKVCDLSKGLEENCVRYGEETYKPEGLMQRNSERMRFGVMAYSKDNSKSRDGGVLRANMDYIGINHPDGTNNTKKTFNSSGITLDKPITFAANDLVNSNPSYTGAINYINKFHKGGYKSFDPISELYYEAIRYFKNGDYPSSLQGPTPEYINGLENVADDFPVIKNWQDPIQYSCQKNFIIGLNDAFPWLDKKLPGTQFTSNTFQGFNLSNNDFGEPSKADPDINVTTLTRQVHDIEAPANLSCVVGNTYENCLTSSGRQNSYYIAGLAYYANTTDLRSDLEGKQTIATFMIDSQEYNANPPLGPVNMLWLTSKYGGFIDKNDNNKPDLQSEWDNDNDGQPDTYVLASSPDKMLQAFDKAFTEIKSRVGASSSAAANTSQLSANAKVYQARFDSSDWSGQLFAYDLVTESNSGNVNNRLWEAGALIPSAGTRRVFSYDPEKNGAQKGIDFHWESLNDTQQTLLNKDNNEPLDIGKNRVDWLRGDQTYERNKGGVFRDRATRLGDVIHSDPTYAGTIDNYGYSLLSGAEGTSYSTFVTGNIGRQPTVYFGANDGMLHAINADSGNETFAYVPNEIIKDLSILSSPLYGCKETGCKAHKYYVDGSPKVGDAYFNGEWHTVLVGSLGAGGKALFALDVTNPNVFNENNVLWELSTTQAPDETSATTYANELGYTLPQASIVRMANGQWAAIVANGYESANKQATLLIIDIATGELIKMIPTGVGSVASPNGLSTALSVDLNSDRIVDAIYAGDLQGNLWKFNVADSDPDQWKIAFETSTGNPAPLFKACVTTACTDTPQPITAKPQVTRNNTTGGVMVYFGTGKYFERSDNVIGPSPQVQTFYALHDNDQVITQKNTLVEQVISKEGTFSNKYKYRLSTSNTVNYSTHHGWYMDLKTPATNGSTFTAEGERIISGALIRQGRIVFVTMKPASDPCSYGGSSWIMELNALTGSHMDKAVIDISQDYKFDSSDNVSVTNDNGGQETRVISGIQEEALGIIFKTPVVMKHASGAEGKYVNGSSGSLGMIKESAATPAGRQSWRALR